MDEPLTTMKDVYAALGETVLEHPEYRASATIPEIIPSGQRNSTLTSLAGTMRRRGMSDREMFAALFIVNHFRCVPQLSEAEVAGIAKSVARYSPG